MNKRLRQTDLTFQTLQPQQLSQGWGKPQAPKDLWRTGQLAATSEGDMPSKAICGKRGRCYTDLQTQWQFETEVEKN